MTHKIDLVIAYVNNKDTVWRNTYIDYCAEHNCADKLVSIVGNRYGGFDFLDYHLKLANKNMPWLNKIYLLLSNIEQISGRELPSNVEVVLHKDFIWNAYLPTFNSTTIEMFLWNIQNLSEYFIYANDDMLPTKPMKQSDFFDESGKIKIGWRNDKFDKNGNVYAYQCNNNCKALYKAFNKPYDNIMLRPVHSYTPMIKSHCVDAFELLKWEIAPHIKAFRTEYQYNQYIYPIYEELKYGTLGSPLDFLYTETKTDFNLDHHIVCLNIVNRNMEKELTEMLEKIL